MKKRILVSTLIVLSLVCWFVFHQRKSTFPPTVPNNLPPATTNVPLQFVVLTNPAIAAVVANAFARPAYIDENHWNRLMALRQTFLSENQPVEFYARVFDQNEQPVEGATLELILTRVDEKLFANTNFFSLQMGNELTNQPVNLVSDADGWIKLSGITGKSIFVKNLNKDGYSWKRPQIDSFAYEANGERSVGYSKMRDAFNSNKGYIFLIQKN
jgi:hypothetical protein